MTAPDDHPTEETWEQLATGELTGAARDRALAHVVACPTCARTWRALRQIAREARTFDPGVPASAPGAAADVTPIHRTRRALVIGGTVAIAAAAALLLWLRSGDETHLDSNATRGSGASLTIELAPASASHLAWKAVPGTATYTVHVFSLDGRSVWSRATIAAPQTDITPPLPPGDYRWTVEAWSGGQRIATSAPARFSVAR